MFTEDALFYAKQIKAKEVTAESLVEKALNRIEKVNPILNAVTVVHAEEAISTARQYDQYFSHLTELQITELPAFFGVPILLKDLGQSHKGHVSAGGSKLLKEVVASDNDHFVQSIVDAGFIIVGRTNVPELGYKNISDSKMFGAVNNPLDLKRNAGGSSGGAAAAIKAGMVPIATASDGGGSIRIPASFTGLVGLKPSRGRIPVGPGGYRGWQGASVNFALSKSVRDSFELFKAMHTMQLTSPFHLPKMPETELVPLDRPLKIAFSTRTPNLSPLDPQAKALVDQTVDYLKELGHELVPIGFKYDGIEAIQSYYKVNGVETVVMMEEIEAALGRPVTKEDVELMTWAIYRSGVRVPATDYSKILALWDQLRVDLETFFIDNDFDLWLTPTNNGVAPLHHQLDVTDEMARDLGNIDDLSADDQQNLIMEMFRSSLSLTPFTQLQNLSGHPAISLPIKTKEAQLPIGAQFTAKIGQEYLLFQLGQQMEDAGYLDGKAIDITKS